MPLDEEIATVPSKIDLSRTWTWRRSARCAAENHCVEVALLHDDQVAMRSSLEPGDVLLISEQSWRCLVAGIKSGLLSTA
jgi:hypothetical protein